MNALGSNEPDFTLKLDLPFPLFRFGETMLSMIAALPSSQFAYDRA